MKFGWGSRYSLFTHMGHLICTVVVTGLLVFVACVWVWYNFAGGGWRGAVTVPRASYGYAPENPYGLGLSVNSCLGDPKVTQVRETEHEVEVKVIAFTRPFHGGRDCADGAAVQLREPLGGRIVVDGHTGQRVRVTRPIPYPAEETRPAADWRVVKGPEWPSRPAFSLQLPTGWDLIILEGLGPTQARLWAKLWAMEHAWSLISAGRRRILSPSSGPSLDYGVGYEEIGGVGANLLVSMDPGAGYTGAFFHQKYGPNFHIVGEGLTREQQRIAVTVFRSIRLPLPEPGDIIDEDPPPPEAPPPFDDVTGITVPE